MSAITRLHSHAGPLALHRGKLALLIGLALVLALADVWHSELKPPQAIDAVDIAGEAGVLLIISCWIVILLLARPAGRVTNLLFAGISGFWLSSLLDVMDEFLQAPPDSRWFSWLESLPLTAGLLLITYGLWLWHREQQRINQQLLRRERFYREHALIDHLTQLNGAVYMQQQLKRELTLHRHHRQPLSLLLIDLNDFDSYNRRYGRERGDRVLVRTAELILLTIRATDLACRYAGDRFIVLLPQTASDSAALIARQLRDTLHSRHWQGETAPGAAVIALSAGAGDSAESLIQRANDALHSHKRHHHQGRQLR